MIQYAIKNDPRTGKADHVKPIPQWAETVIGGAMQRSGIRKVLITSTTRTPREQAEIMYYNAERYGLDSQYKLYAKPGDAVLQAYSICKGNGESEQDTIAIMQTMIIDLGPERVSRHCRVSDAVSVCDIRPLELIGKQDRFIYELNTTKQVVRIHPPHIDPAFHLELSA